MTLEELNERLGPSHQRMIELVAEMLSQPNEFYPDFLGAPAEPKTLRQRLAECRRRLADAWLVLRGKAQLGREWD